MKLAFELSFYAFVLLFFFGLFLLIWLFRWVFGERDILNVFPHTKEIPSPTLEEAKQLFKQMRVQVSRSPGKRMAGDLEAMDRLLEEIEFRTKNQRNKYHRLCKEREDTWHSLKEMVECMSAWEKAFGKKKNIEYAQGIQHYKDLEKHIADAVQHVLFQEELLLAEVRDREIFRLNYNLLRPSKQKSSTE